MVQRVTTVAFEGIEASAVDDIKTKLDLEEERREKAGLRDLTRREFAGKIGDALRDLDEFSELTAADVQALEASLRGVPDDDVIVVFTKKATDLVANKRVSVNPTRIASVSQALYDTGNGTQVLPRSALYSTNIN